MAANICRHSYTDFSTNPYIYYHGVPFKMPSELQYPQDCDRGNYNRENRTIIRTNQPNVCVKTYPRINN